MATKSDTLGIMAESAGDTRAEVIELLTKAYWMEIETVMSYIANSINPDGVRAQEIRGTLFGEPATLSMSSPSSLDLSQTAPSRSSSASTRP